MQKAYKYSIVYFIAFSLLLLGSSILLFEEKIGLSNAAILEYYLGNEEKFILAKSWSVTLEIILPHLFAFGLLIMVALHFLIFTKFRASPFFKYFIYSTFLAGFLELSSPFFILQGFEIFASIKLFSFIVLELLLLTIFWLLLKSIFLHRK